MSEIKALDKLRCHYNVSGCADLQRCCEEIEAEVADNYMRLPCDADGVPIHVGDELFNKNKPTDVYKVTAIADNGYIRIYHDTAHIHSSQCLHVKPRTLKDALIEYRLKAYNLYADQELTGEERVDEFKKLDAEYDSEIRELMGEGEVIDEPDTIRNELADGGLIADALAPVCVDEKERRAFERGRVHERFAQQIFKEATS